ncbi:MAG: NTP transferase domain-containing protein [Candidatus Velamenicoccus archaeovorus]
MADTVPEHDVPFLPSPDPLVEAVPIRPRIGVVLAAGRSERLSEHTGGGSKALVRVGGLALVERAVRTLLAAGIEHVIVVVGYQAGPVAAMVNRLAPGRVRAVFAERWEAGNGASLSAAEPHVAGEPLFALVTADHVFGEGALEALISAGVPGVLVDPAPGSEAWDEGTRVRLHHERAVAFSKQLGDPAIDCGAFLLPGAVFEAQRRAEAAGDASLSAAVTELAAEHPLVAVPLPPQLWWQDVDTPEDLARVRRSLRRSLVKEADGPVSRYLNRPVSSRLSMMLAPLRLHPDLVSMVAFAVALVGGWFLARNLGVAGAVLVHLSSILDGVDGELARLQVRSSPGGALLDGVLDRLGDAAILAGLATWAIHQGEAAVTVVVIGVAATTGAMLSMATKDRIVALGIPPAPERWIGFLFGGRDARLLFVAIAALLGHPMWGLIAIVATSALSLAVRLLLSRSTLRGAWPGGA